MGLILWHSSVNIIFGFAIYLLNYYQTICTYSWLQKLNGNFVILLLVACVSTAAAISSFFKYAVMRTELLKILIHIVFSFCSNIACLQELLDGIHTCMERSEQKTGTVPRRHRQAKQMEKETGKPNLTTLNTLLLTLLSLNSDQDQFSLNDIHTLSRD